MLLGRIRVIKWAETNFLSLNLVKIADDLEMNLTLKDRADGIEYVINYPEDERGNSKRNMTEEEKRLHRRNQKQ